MIGPVYGPIAGPTVLRTTAARRVGDGSVLLVGPEYLNPAFTFTRASAATYFDSAGVLQTAAVNQPRYDYDPATLAYRGLLIEEARTNLLTHSQLDTVWNAAGATPPTKTEGVSYLGVSCTSALFTSAMTSTGYSGCRIDRGMIGYQAPITAGTQYAYVTYISLSRALTGTESLTHYWTGAEGSSTFVINSSNSAQFVGKWVRVSIVYTPGTSGLNYPVLYLSGVMSSDVTAYVCRGQCEVGAFATSYIPTVGSVASRAIDDADFTIPAGIVRLNYVYDDDTTADVAVTPGDPYTIPAGAKAVKYLRGYRE